MRCTERNLPDIYRPVWQLTTLSRSWPGSETCRSPLVVTCSFHSLGDYRHRVQQVLLCPWSQRYPLVGAVGSWFVLSISGCCCRCWPLAEQWAALSCDSCTSWSSCCRLFLWPSEICTSFTSRLLERVDSEVLIIRIPVVCNNNICASLRQGALNPTLLANLISP